MPDAIILWIIITTVQDWSAATHEYPTPVACEAARVAAQRDMDWTDAHGVHRVGLAECLPPESMGVMPP